jgi:spore germination cell wall hydrolase CwlJ-like protein
MAKNLLTRTAAHKNETRMLNRFRHHHRSLKLAGLLGFAMVFVASAAPGAATPPSGRSVRMKAHDIAVATGGDYSQAGFERGFADADSSMLAYARQLWAVEDPLIADAGAGSDASPEAAERFSARALKALSWDAARLVNASIPISRQANPAAPAFRLPAGDEDRARAVQCLTEAVYYEAAYESADGQAAVAQVVLNRLRHPVYPKTVCGVVYQGHERPTGCQFTFTCDGALARAPVEPLWSRARQVAERALNGHVAQSVGNATHYHADYVVPYWLPSLAKVARIGTHVFYRWSGGFGLPQAFTGRYAGAEPLRGGTLMLAKAAEVQAEADAMVVARLGPVVEAPAIQLAETATVSIATATAVARPEELTLETPKIRLPNAAPPPFAIRPACVNTTLGNCSY